MHVGGNTGTMMRPSGGHIEWFRNQEGERFAFEPRGKLAEEESGEAPTDYRFADLEGDGTDDLLLVQRWGIDRLDREQYLSEDREREELTLAGMAKFIEIGDIDGEGDLDLVTGRTGDKIGWFPDPGGESPTDDESDSE